MEKEGTTVSTKICWHAVCSTSPGGSCEEVFPIRRLTNYSIFATNDIFCAKAASSLQTCKRELRQRSDGHGDFNEFFASNYVLERIL